MLKRILLPTPAETDDERLVSSLWTEFIAEIGAHGVETHKAECTCTNAGCARLRVFRKYLAVYLRVRRQRYSVKQLQTELDEFVAENNEQVISNAHAEALEPEVPF